MLLDPFTRKFVAAGVDSRESQTLVYIKKSGTTPVSDATISGRPNAIVMIYVEGRNLPRLVGHGMSYEEKARHCQEDVRHYSIITGAYKGNYIGVANW